MRKSILTTLLILPLLVACTFAADNFSSEPFGEPFGYSSEELLGGGSYLGVDTRNVTSDRLSALKLKEERGVEVTMVDQDAPAGKAGLKEHDVILTVNGTDLESVEQLRRMIRETPPGRVVTLGISRDGQPLTMKVQLADRKKAWVSIPETKEFNFTMPAMPAMPDIDVPVSVVIVHSSLRSGLMVENLTPQLGDFFGAHNGEGVLVRSVDKGSRAEKAGFHAGDVIVRVNGEAIHDSSDFSHALRSRTEKSVNVSIIRDKKEQTLTLTLPERKQSDLFEQSFDVPDFDAESLNLDLSELRSEMAHLQPQFALAMEQARRSMEEMKNSLCQQRQDMRKKSEELKKQQQDLKKQMRDQKRELREQIQIELQGLTEI
ncbi:MAG: PDZ domain-containing protein [Acidobacteriia bacterium]|nr:PDZ domain-containing protein [Terriglobia bacterium]